MRRRAAALAAAALLCGGCLRLGYGATWIEQPLDHGALQALVPGHDDLASCLRKLGAPNYVWEYRGTGVALGWYHMDATDWDFDASYAFIGRNAPGASFSLDWDDNDLPGAVLWFDDDLRLLEWREGNMRQLASGLRLRPAPIDELERPR